ncbi:MAG: hypothetical protein OXG87_03535 [Gemmatimonadetes bacterium]|nr:hypothetical protein [Gemmatimonadota bacterium]
MKEDNFAEIALFQDAQKLQLKNVDGGFLICTLQNLNEIVELKPNFFGLGININKAIEKLQKTIKKKLSSKF